MTQPSPRPEGKIGTPLHLLSLGAGVQSTTMALMAAHGEITPMPSAAIFADTQGEPAAVYEHLKWLMSPNVLPFPVHVVTAGNLWASATRVRTRRDGGATYVATGIPVFMTDGLTKGIASARGTSRSTLSFGRRAICSTLSACRSPAGFWSRCGWVSVRMKRSV